MKSGVKLTGKALFPSSTRHCAIRPVLHRLAAIRFCCPDHGAPAQWLRALYGACLLAACSSFWLDAKRIQSSRLTSNRVSLR
jgi:hypothetical protein